MPKHSVGCPECKTTTWTTTEKGSYSRDVTFYTDEPDMEFALDFAEEGSDGHEEFDSHFEDEWVCKNGHPADKVVAGFINDLLEDEDDEDDVLGS
jgi:hypothetical protein